MSVDKGKQLYKMKYMQYTVFMYVQKFNNANNRWSSDNYRYTLGLCFVMLKWNRRKYRGCQAW